MFDTRWQSAVLEASMDAVITVDSQGCIRGWNAAAQAMFGRSRAEVTGRELAETVVPEHLRAAHRVGLRQLAAGGPGRIRDGRTETTGRRADGSLFPVELTITRIEDGDDVLFVGFLRDLTEQRRMLDDLRDSRIRLIGVSDETRRRIERDLHDGAQQRLVALAVSLGRARERLVDDPVAAAAALQVSADLLAGAIDELRELARGIHDAVLTERGLQAALANLTRRSPIDVALAVDTGRLPAPVETSVYYLVAEALTNATKYGARQVRIDVRAVAGGRSGPARLVGSVLDDGPGGADPARGTGLTGMTERLAALGGTVAIASPQGAGTAVRFEVPAGLR